MSARTHSWVLCLTGRQAGLIDASLTPQQWQHFAQTHGERLTGDASTYMPWLLNGASPQTLEAVLGKFPPPLLAAYREHPGGGPGNRP